MSNSILPITLLSLSYFLGAIPFALLFAKVKNINLRKEGSGNLGASNVFRVMGATYGTLVFILDAAKGWLPCFLSIHFFTNFFWLHVACGAMAILGHSFTCFAQFKGGKGVATAAGMILALNPFIFLIICPTTLITIKITRYVAPCSLLASLAIPVLFYYFKSPLPYIISTSLISILIFWRHRSNIKRLINGKENKI